MTPVTNSSVRNLKLSKTAFISARGRPIWMMPSSKPMERIRYSARPSCVDRKFVTPARPINLRSSRFGFICFGKFERRTEPSLRIAWTTTPSKGPESNKRSSNRRAVATAVASTNESSTALNSREDVVWYEIAPTAMVATAASVAINRAIRSRRLIVQPEPSNPRHERYGSTATRPPLRFCDEGSRCTQRGS